MKIIEINLYKGRPIQHEPPSVKDCWENKTFLFKGICIVGKHYGCRYQGNEVERDGIHFYECKKFKEEKK